MTDEISEDLFDGVATIVSEPLKFKAKLAIGEDAYTSLRLKNAAFEVWDAFGVAATAASVAKSSAVAASFFAPQGLLAAFGIGAAVTPVGWVLAAGVVAGGAWVGVTRYIKGASSKRVTIVPNFINTPLDVLGLALFDLMAPLALKVAMVDGELDPAEREFIQNYFVREWGYEPAFVDAGLSYTESKLDDFSIKEVARSLAEFKKKNPDCNYQEMAQEILSFLRGIMESDGQIDEREEMAIDRVAQIFDEVSRLDLGKTILSGLRRASSSFQEAGATLARQTAGGAKVATDAASNVFGRAAGEVRNVAVGASAVATAAAAQARSGIANAQSKTKDLLMSKEKKK